MIRGPPGADDAPEQIGSDGGHNGFADGSVRWETQKDMAERRWSIRGRRGYRLKQDPAPTR